tara:strand:+ start:388 stop:792 length:405 start_codon:yes stop_codon:yes gene_type:complete
MKDAVFDQVIFSVAIVYSRSLFEEIKELDQHILISIFATIIAIISTQFYKLWTETTKKLQNKDKTYLWRNIVAQWLKILQMISTFIAIHNLVDLVNAMILNTERFYYESLLFPAITIMFSIAAVTLFDHHFFSS